MSYSSGPAAGAGPGPGKLDHGLETVHPDRPGIQAERETERGWWQRGQGERHRDRGSGRGTERGRER